MDFYKFQKLIELNSYKGAFMWALFFLNCVVFFFLSLGNLLDGATFFYVITSACDLVIILVVFYGQAHIIAAFYIIIVFFQFYTYDFDYSWVIDLANKAAIVETGEVDIYTASLTGFFLYVVLFFFGVCIDFLVGYDGATEFFFFIISEYAEHCLIWVWLHCYVIFAALSYYYAAAGVLFLSLLTSLALGLAGNKLGVQYAGYLASLSTGVGAFFAFYLWIIYPLIFKFYHPVVIEFFRKREEYYHHAYDIISTSHRVTMEDGVSFETFYFLNTYVYDVSSWYCEYNFKFAKVILNFLNNYEPFVWMKGRNDFEFTTGFGKIFKLFGTEAEWLFCFDNLGLTAAFTVLIISFFVHLFSCDYMANDPHAVRFFAYLSLFTFFMVALVLSANMVVFYIAWEGVGLCSFLLISFWFTRAQATKAALKALLINKIGDVFLLIAAAKGFAIARSLDFSVIFLVVPVEGQKIANEFFNLTDLDVFCILLLAAAAVKSAQLFFHVWLADAMEGPTPVSALLHAATMVTAGVFLIIRFSFVFEYSALALNLMIYLGLITSIVSGLIGLFQFDIKKIIAYSTCSQLGLMFLACGLSGYTFALFHFFNHAFFKALLFLSAGVLIHALKNEQDIRKMGGLKNVFPFTYMTFLIASLSLVGFPFFSGYFSKDAIIALVYSSVFFGGVNSVIFYLTIFSIFLTCLYSFKLIFYVFLGDKTNISKCVHNQGFKEKLNFFIVVPLFSLGVLSIVSGALFKDYFIGLGSNFYYSSSILTLSDSVKYVGFFKEQKIITLFVLIFSYLVCCVVSHYLNNPKFKKIAFHYCGYLKNLYVFFNKKAFFDEVYNLFIVSNLFRYCYTVFEKLDKGLLEIFGPAGIYATLKKISFSMKTSFNKGPIIFLIKFMFMGVIIILFLFYLISSLGGSNISI